MMNEHVAKTVEMIEEKIEKLNQLVEFLRELGETGEETVPALQEPIRQRRKYTRRAKPADEPAPSSKLQDAVVPVDNKNLTPLSDGGVQIGRTLTNPFTITDLRARLDGEPTRASNWIFAWKNKGWIEPNGFGQYKKTEAFGA
jgi:hypothetical protein